MASHLQWNGKIKEQDRIDIEYKGDEKVEAKNGEIEEKTKNNKN